MGFTQCKISLRRNGGEKKMCPNPEYSVVCADTIFLSGRCTDWVMSSELNPNCSWDSVTDASLTICWEIAHCDRQEANCESFSNVTTDWHRLRDKTSRCAFRRQAWRSYIHYKRQDFSLGYLKRSNVQWDWLICLSQRSKSVIHQRAKKPALPHRVKPRALWSQAEHFTDHSNWYNS